ncbi:DUF3331 domain-containing protein [Burkholderia sp. L27(2015)]|uniref:DUF3331 domain-containing protein n=1 Tax=Burkholderia sp. L27(2015) TaxID=1641858 RepID=UPI00349E891D
MSLAFPTQQTQLDSNALQTELDLRWLHILRSLQTDGVDAKPSHQCDRRRGRGAPGQTQPKNRYQVNTQIEVLDRPSQFCALISWRDSTRCSYCYQLWRRAVSKKAGFCAISGDPINRGDEIFRPCVRNTIPLNASAMILATHIDLVQVAAS